MKREVSKMKKIFLTVISTLSLATFVYADICSDLTDSYNRLMTQLSNDTNLALSMTTDPAEMAAIRQSYEIQLSMLQAQKESSLISAGCTSNVPPVTDPTEPPTTDPTTDPTDPTDPPEIDPTPTDPPVEDPNLPPGDDGGPVVTGPNCREQLQAYACQLKAQGMKGRDLVFRLREKAVELQCDLRNYKGQANRGLIGRKCHTGHTVDCRKEEVRREECKQIEVRKEEVRKEKERCEVRKDQSRYQKQAKHGHRRGHYR
ncbi:MAG: hypothetical protein A2901_03150 [Elusimicrobia bacterium RIFCSPLOWO2_01_FULL_54_10]|nr:MAG: hypothetical protein A2901_03150 [Elusimicrobia bacterium RIFCSPLOWO2_01_FULL_54_10]